MSAMCHASESFYDYALYYNAQISETKVCIYWRREVVLAPGNYKTTHFLICVKS